VNGRNVVIDGSLLSSVTCVKYLGVYLDSRLSWSTHINFAYDKLIKFTGIFYKLCSCMCGGASRIVRNVVDDFSKLLFNATFHSNSDRERLRKQSP